ncbi:TPA: TIR domain-containing protein [Klebsiella quasipneumoniae]|nr:TIR domain-containing protein [Raoultella ornithinolytica]
MSSSKPVLFISHITEEKEVALKLKELIDGAFIGLFDTFVSTSPESIQMGNKWLDQISNALHKSAIAIIICSPASVKRPWINFEAGAAWVRDINVIPLCHSGIKPSELPVPLSELQGALASDPSSVRLVLSVLAQALNSKVPNPDVTDFTKFVSEFESTYTLKKTISEIVERIREYDPNIDRKLKNSTPFELAVPLSNDGQFRKDATFLEEKKLAKVQQLVGVSTSSIGMVAIYGIQRLKNLI